MLPKLSEYSNLLARELPVWGKRVDFDPLTQEIDQQNNSELLLVEIHLSCFPHWQIAKFDEKARNYIKKYQPYITGCKYWLYSRILFDNMRRTW